MLGVKLISGFIPYFRLEVFCCLPQIIFRIFIKLFSHNEVEFFEGNKLFVFRQKGITAMRKVQVSWRLFYFILNGNKSPDLGLVNHLRIDEQVFYLGI